MVLIAAVQAVEPALKKASVVPDAQPAEVSVDAEPVDCEPVLRALLPGDCSALAGVDSQEQRRADRFSVVLAVQRSVLVDLLPADY